MIASSGHPPPGGPLGDHNPSLPPDVPELSDEEKARQAMIFAAMQEELGIHRKDTLHLDDRGYNPVNASGYMVNAAKRRLPTAIAAWTGSVLPAHIISFLTPDLLANSHRSQV